MSIGRRVEDNCDIVTKVDNPNTLYCHRTEPFLTQIKGYGSYTIPRVDVQFSGTYQTKPGPLVLALYTATNAEVAPSLGRNLAGGAPSVDLDIYNALNSSAVLEQNDAFGAWQTPLEILVARFYKFSVQFDF